MNGRDRVTSERVILKLISATAPTIAADQGA